MEPLPAHAARAFELASDPKTTTSDFVAVIESDEALSARIVRVANSVYFYRGSAATDIEKAVANIGVDELRCILSAAMLKGLLVGRSQARQQIWANAVSAALLARSLARYVGGLTQGEAFLAGLVHDVGKLVMLSRAPALYEKVLSLVAADNKSFIEAEEQIFELNHVEVGTWVAQEWKFPLSIVEAIALHHQAWPTDPNRLKSKGELALLVQISDHLSHAAGIGHAPNFSSFRKKCEADLYRCFPQLGLSSAEGRAMLAQHIQDFEEQYSNFEAEVG